MRTFFRYATIMPALFCLMRFAGAQEAGCQVTKSEFRPDAVATAAMVVDGAVSCHVRFRIFGREPENWQLIEAPKSGKVSFEGDAAEYRPEAGFAGEDRFAIAFTGVRPNCTKNCFRRHHYAVAVTVKPKP